jgi:phage tail sheath gpL-like
MSVAFNRTPNSIRVPFFYAEVNAGLNYYAGNSKHLIIGQKLSGGTATANVPFLVQTDNLETLVGAGSMIMDMVRTAKRNNPLGEIWVLPLADPAGAAQTQTVTISGTLTPGNMTLYVGGKKVTVPVTAADTVTTVAAAFVAAINAGLPDLDGRTYLLPMSAANVAGVITLTARHVGASGATIGVEKDYVGDEGPGAANIAIAAGTSGSGNPSLTSGLAALGDVEYDMISMPYSDTTSLNSMRDFLADTGGRWDPTRGLYGACFTANFGNLAAQSSLGSGRNDPNVHIMGVQGSPTPVWVWAAAIGAQVQLHKNLGAPLSEAGEISRPMHTLVLEGVMPPKSIASRWSQSDRQTLYFDGISGYTVTPDGRVMIDRLISTYQTNALGSADTTWLDVETRYQTAYALRYFRQVITQTYARHGLVDDNPGNLQGFTTPREIKATLVHSYANLVANGIMKNTQLFADSIVVEKSTDPNRVNAYLPLDVANQLRIFAANATTFLDAAAN